MSQVMEPQTAAVPEPRMSQVLIDLMESRRILTTARYECHLDRNNFGWDICHHADQYLDKQMKAYFSPEEIQEAV